MKAAIVKNNASFFWYSVYIVETKLIKMEMQISDLPVLQKSKETKMPVTKAESSCCSQPSNSKACCTPSKSTEENNGACCAQPSDGSACCDK
jgi:hypothetical protein